MTNRVPRDTIEAKSIELDEDDNLIVHKKDGGTVVLEDPVLLDYNAGGKVVEGDEATIKFHSTLPSGDQ